MTVLATVVALHDIDDVDAFVQATLNASGINFGREERDELVAEGIAILYKLAETYEPHLPGYAGPGRFSGYAARYLPRRLTDAWHRLHPEHFYSAKADGTREWVFLEQPLSLDQLQARSRAAARDDGGTGTGEGSVDAHFLPSSQWTRPAVAA